MSHWAEINEQNIVVNVVVGNNDDADEGYQFLIDNFGGRWIKTSYNTFAGKHLLNGTPLRKNYAGIGFTYDEDRDAFIMPKPFASWILDEDTCRWQAPAPMPTDDKLYVWDEATTSWVEIQ